MFLINATIIIISGTGVPPVRKTTVVDIFRPDNVIDTLKLVGNWDGMGKLILESVLNADGAVVDRCRGWCAAAGTAYFRFSPLMQEEIELDEKDDKQLIELMWSAMILVHTKQDDVRKIRDLLLPDITFEQKSICHRSVSSTSIPSRMSMTAMTAMDVE